jgi:hypothetical protein
MISQYTIKINGQLLSDSIVENYGESNESFTNIAKQNIFFGLEPALSTLTIFFSQKEIKENVSSDYLIMAASIASAAVPLFAKMNDDMKASMISVAYLLCKVELSKLSEEGITKSVYERLSLAFARLKGSNFESKINTSKSDSVYLQPPKKGGDSSYPSNPLTNIQKPINPYSRSILNHFQEFTLLSVRLKNPYDEQVRISHIKQVDKICRIWNNCLRDYLLTDNASKERRLKKLQNLLPPAVGQLFFPDPRNLEERDKKLISSLFEEFKNFFSNLSHAAEKQKNKLEASALIKDMYTFFFKNNVIRYSFSNKAIEEMSCQEIEESINQELEYRLEQLIQTLLKAKAPSEKQNAGITDFFSYSGALFLMTEIESIFSPYGISVFLHRLISDGISLKENQEEKSPPLSVYQTDTALRDSLASNFEKIKECALIIGEAPLGLKTLIQSSKIIITMPQIADKVVRSINKILNSPTTLTPVLIADSLLFRKEKEKKIPALRGCFNKTEAEKQKFIKETTERVCKEFYSHFEASIESNVPLGTLTGLRIAGLKDFLERLVEKIITCFNQKEIIHLLIIHLIKGVENLFPLFE